MVPSETEAFSRRVLLDTSGAYVTVLAALGDQLGLFRSLDVQGPASPAELARRLSLSEPHVGEWLVAMVAAGYLALGPGPAQFHLPDAHAPALAREQSAAFLGGAHQSLVGMARPLDRIAETFRNGGGVPQSGFPEETLEGMERFYARWLTRQLLEVGLPRSGLDARLAAGIELAEVSCGGGTAMVELASAFPRSRFAGYDPYGPLIRRARARAVEAGVDDRVAFHQRDVADGVDGSYHAFIALNVLGDAADPLALLRAVRRSLRPGGLALFLELRRSPSPTEQQRPLGALLSATGVLYSRSTSLAHASGATGARRLDAPAVRVLASAAGFGSIRQLPDQDLLFQLLVLAT